MRKVILVAVAVVVVFACSEPVGQVLVDAGDMLADAGDMMQPDAGAQSQTFPVDCSGGGFVLTNVDQKELGKVIIHQRFPDPWGATDPPQMVDYQAHAWWSINGKVLVQCSGDTTSASIEVLP